MSAEQKTVTFELLAGIERQAGCRYIDVQVDSAHATVGDALRVLQNEYPKLHDAIERCACAVGDAIVRRQAALPASGAIVLLPPVSGG